MAGCVSNKPGGESSSAAPSEPTAAAPEDISGKISICLDSQLEGVFNDMIPGFNKLYPNIEVEPLFGKEQDTLVAAGQAPDLLKTGDLLVTGMKEQLLDLSALVERDKAEVKPEDYINGTFESMQVDGKQYAIPVSFTIALLYYNKDLFDKAAVEYPTDTWTQKDFIDAAKKMTLTENKTATQWGSSTVFGWWGEWLIYVRQAGGEWMKDGKCVLDTPEAAEGVKFFYDKTTLGENKIAPAPKDDSFGGFAGGKVAMEVGGHTGNWVSFNAIEGLNYDVQVIPKSASGTSGSECTVEGYGISSASKNQEAAWAFLKYWTSTEGGEIYAKMGRPVPRKSVRDIMLAIPVAERPQPQNLEAVYSALENEAVFNTHDPLFEPAQQTVVQPYIDQILEGKVEIGAAMKEATQKANEYLELNR